MKQVISVRNLVEFVGRSGDLDMRFSGKNTALEGTRAHQHIQSQMGSGYQSEVMLRTTVELEGVELTVQGRADGLFLEEEIPWIDEIKSSPRELDEIDDAGVPVHWAQAKCYAYICGVDDSAVPSDPYGIQLTYVKQHTYETKRIRSQFQFHELETFFMETVKKYMKWLYERRDWLKCRNASIKQSVFPFSGYRKGQRELSVGIYTTIREGLRGFYQAPTGIGKTMSSLFPAIKALGENHADRIFYLTAKTITRSVAQDSANILAGQGMRIRRATLTAKDKVCFETGSACQPDECSYAKGHFDRVNDAIWDIMQESDAWHRETIEKIAQKHHVCPFEFSLDLALMADVVICDYNYAFDPRVYLRRFFDENSDNFVFLIDEAHNLVDRAREMYSAELSKEKVMSVKRQLPDWHIELKKSLEKVNRVFLEWKKTCGQDEYYVDNNPPDEIYPQLRKWISLAEDWLLENQSSKCYEDVLDLYFDSMRFLRIYEIYDDCYVSLYERQGKDLRMRMYCIDPSFNLSEKLKNAKASVFFSATLTPLKYYRRILGGREDDPIRAFDSPFDPGRRFMMLSRGISTRLRDREYSMNSLVDYLETFIKGHVGNYLIFFPSYKYLNTVYDLLIEKFGDFTAENNERAVSFLIQETDMSELEREDFLSAFQPGRKKTLVGLCVLGGIFSEGIDLHGDRVTGVAIVGVGLPTVSLENNLIKDYFDREDNSGFAFAYAYPGLNKVMQAAGRLIRSEEDAGLILLLDDRYNNRYYKNMLPHDWNPLMLRKEDMHEKMETFWQEIDSEEC